MGYKRKVYKLVFEDPEFEGLVVRTRGASIEKAATLADLAALGQGLLAAEHKAEREQLYQQLHSVIVDWNLVEDDDTPVPCTVDTLRDQDWQIVFELLTTWLRTVMGVSRPLAPTSSAGAPSLEVSLPMEVLSPSPESSPVPS